MVDWHYALCDSLQNIIKKEMFLFIHSQYYIILDRGGWNVYLGHHAHGCTTSQHKHQLKKGVEGNCGAAEEVHNVEDGVLHRLVPTNGVSVIQQHLISFNEQLFMQGMTSLAL